MEDSRGTQSVVQCCRDRAYIGRRGSEAASEEQPDTLRKTVQFWARSFECSTVFRPNCTSEYLANGETQDRLGSVLVLKSGHVDDDVQISASDVFYEMDGRRGRYIREVLDWYRKEDGGDLKRSELNELVENMTCLNAFAGENLKSNP